MWFLLYLIKKHTLVIAQKMKMKMKTYESEQKEPIWKTMTAQKNCDSFKEQRTWRIYSYDIYHCVWVWKKSNTNSYINKGEGGPKLISNSETQEIWKQSERKQNSACMSVLVWSLVCLGMTAKTCILHSLRKYLCLICNWFENKKQKQQQRTAH